MDEKPVSSPSPFLLSFPFLPPGQRFCLRVRTSWSQNQGKLVTRVLAFTPTPISPLAHLPRGSPPRRCHPPHLGRE